MRVITQAIRAGKAERRIKEHSGPTRWETFHRYGDETDAFRDIPAKGIES